MTGCWTATAVAVASHGKFGIWQPVAVAGHEEFWKKSSQVDVRVDADESGDEPIIGNRVHIGARRVHNSTTDSGESVKEVVVRVDADESGDERTVLAPLCEIESLAAGMFRTRLRVEGRREDYCCTIIGGERGMQWMLETEWRFKSGKGKKSRGGLLKASMSDDVGLQLATADERSRT
ncbi:hypothetical protein SISNIDRAFT_471185 [Sistotremastrum niveocremeum HHB9708]|uniref:Uncharacterized protein n=1 Tax=Sistotremastrum niveocremeum HHB9708 TaxID=1314777 RepID=A0A164MY45_9AGAM|nr:hypothetical protein SISNIDRAFT_471185 [Sistotremastrum niveocremeum HHB9708]